MPELPEVETICRYLQKIIIGQEISSVKVNRRDLRFPIVGNLSDVLTGRIIEDVYRRAKYINITMNNAITLVIHLGMTGKLLYNSEFDKHDHVHFGLSDGNLLTFNDVRRFGAIFILTDIKHFFSKMGPEPLAENFNSEILQEQLRNYNAAVKNALLNGKVISGIGNIYASEILFQARISPLKKANSLSLSEYETLTHAIKTILQKAIEAGGTTLQDYRTPYNGEGYFQHDLKVYNCAKCNVCNDDLVKIKQCGRSTFYCQDCQKM